MKKLSFILMNLLLAASVLMTSCKKDEESDPETLAVDFIAGDGYVTSSADVEPGETFTVKLHSKKLDKNMTTFMIMADQNIGLISGVSITGFEDKDTDVATNPIELKGTDKDEFTIEATIRTLTVPGVYTYTFTVVDKDENTATGSVTINVAEPATLTAYSAKLLGAQSASAGSFFATTTGAVISTSDFDANSSIIDLSYGEIGSTKAEPMFASSDARSDLGLSSGTGGLKCYYKESSIDFTTATVEQVSAISASSNQSIVIEAGKVYEFVNENGGKGLIEVVSISDYNTSTPDFKSSVSINVKRM